MTSIDLNPADWLEQLQTDDHAVRFAARSALQAMGRAQDGLALAQIMAQSLTSMEAGERRAARHGLIQLCSHAALAIDIMPQIMAAVTARNGQIRGNARTLVASLMERHADCVALHDALRPAHVLVTPMSFSPIHGWQCVMTYPDGHVYYSDKPRRRTPAHNVLRAAHTERFRYGVDHLASFVVRATLQAGAAGCIPAQQALWLMQKIEARSGKDVLPPRLQAQLIAAESVPPEPPRAARKDLLPKAGAGLITINDGWC